MGKKKQPPTKKENEDATREPAEAKAGESWAGRLADKEERDHRASLMGVGDSVESWCPSKAGDGLLSFNLVGGRTAVSRIQAMSPLKFIEPSKTSNSASNVERTTDKVGAAWVYVIGFGGGLVTGDCIRVRVSVGQGSTAIVTTQASTKVYQQRHGKYCEQFMSSSVDDGGMLALIVDPVVPYAGSRFRQRQDFHLRPPSETEIGGSLALIDWYTSGRRARGESWDFDHYETVNSIYIGGKLLVQDAQRLSTLDGSACTIKGRMHPFECFATVILVGPRTADLCRSVSEAVRSRQSERVPGVNDAFVGVGGKRGRHPGEGEEVERDDLVCSASELDSGGLVLRVAGVEYEPVELFLRTHLKGLESVCGTEVWRRKFAMH